MLKSRTLPIITLSLIFALVSCGVWGRSGAGSSTTSPPLCANSQDLSPSGSLTWLPAAGPTAKAVVIVVHGLNNKPEVMNPLSAALNAAGLHAARVTLAGHESREADRQTPGADTWVDDIEQAYCAARRRYPSLPVYGLGFSTGALAEIAFLDRRPDAQISKLVLIAPAAAPARRVFALRLLNWLRVFNLGLPSLAPPEYRSADSTSFDAYHAMLTLVDRVADLEHAGRLAGINTLVAMSPDDELVSFNRTRAWIERNQLTEWRTVELQPDPHVKCPYHHLVIDEKGLGEKEWQRLVGLVLDQFGAVSAPQKDGVNQDIPDQHK